jgi:putative ATPase
MKPLAYTMRPNSFSNIVGQDHLVGENGVLKKMIETKHLFSFILYGNPGCGKTTIAEAFCKESGLSWHKFNASTDNKEALKQIIQEARFEKDSLMIVDEIHRMKKDIQDFLLPYVESGDIILIGLTTVNPYHSVNPAIRSRCHIYRINDLREEDLTKVLERAKDLIAKDKIISQEVYSYLIQTANREIRSMINNFETLVLTCDHPEITLDDAKASVLKSNIAMDASNDNYFDTLSGLQKSIRGSDVDASLHYLAMLLAAEDFDSLCRRLLAIAYEDIGLANPGIGPRVVSACNAARELGNPEAKLPLSVVVIEMALSPKSNSAMLAITKAQSDVESGKGGTLPKHLKNTYSFDPSQKSYLYPHDYPNSWVDQQYLPDILVDAKYYEPKPTSKFETGLYNRYQEIESWKKAAKEKKQEK